MSGCLSTSVSGSAVVQQESEVTSRASRVSGNNVDSCLLLPSIRSLREELFHFSDVVGPALRFLAVPSNLVELKT